MENASKALLMTGGILIALIIISMLLLMITNIGDYQRTKDSGTKATQVAKFNSDFERYTDDNGIKGTDIVSLINKIADYNSRQTDNTSSSSGSTNYVDYNIRMSITIRGLEEFNEKYAYSDDSSIDQLFPNDSYTFGENRGNAIKQQLDNFTQAESYLGLAKLKQLSSVYDPNLTKSKNEEKIREKLEDWNGDPTLDTIKKYRQYSEFKTSKFRSYQDPIYENGQIQQLFFEFIE